MKKKITVADLVMGVSGLVTFIFSFLPFFKFGDEKYNAWNADAGAFATTVPAILGLIMVVWIALELAGVDLPDQILSYSRTQLKGTWGIAATVIMLSWVSTDFGGADKGVGFWLMLIGSLGMATGAVMALLGKGTEVVGGARATGDPVPAPAHHLRRLGSLGR